MFPLTSFGVSEWAHRSGCTTGYVIQPSVFSLSMPDGVSPSRVYTRVELVELGRRVAEGAERRATVWRDGNAASTPDVQLEVPEAELVKGVRS